ncbi:Uncharacterized protein conserved in bacteria [Clostridium putrefaciens]|uniref:Uncharacterized protein conserved in bacteria n=1 Tax=Clostridium putrefaciens TaxID=99675 RepID=A0A381J8U7_9CLOT|nr:DUF1287 domain-containing protein [Clostridium putrefaciens]SUY46817.1 Uncharacterized protein conserved in bacteria [Clostridium putrefaciens]
MKRKGKRLLIFMEIIAILVVGYVTLSYWNLIPEKVYKAKDFSIEIIKSQNDYNDNGIDDYTDILLGARKDALNKPVYKSVYYDGGYPPEKEGVCSDVIWRAFENAGYSLKDMVDEDINNNLLMYQRVGGKAEKNIDFRRVPNLKVYFDNNAVSYSLDPYEVSQWQPGDIVIFGEDYSHIAIVSDKRNSEGVSYIIHNAAQPKREEDALISYSKSLSITGHYRFE